jgi:hypothetical protein
MFDEFLNLITPVAIYGKLRIVPESLHVQTVEVAG